MLFILAELPDPQSAPSVGWLVLGLAAIAVAVNQVGDLIARFRRKESQPTELTGQPIEVRGAPDYVRREEFDVLCRRVARMETKFDEGVLKLSEQGEDRARRLHARIDALPERVIELLATTQRLHTK